MRSIKVVITTSFAGSEVAFTKRCMSDVFAQTLFDSIQPSPDIIRVELIVDEVTQTSKRYGTVADLSMDHVLPIMQPKDHVCRNCTTSINSFDHTRFDGLCVVCDARYH